MYRTINLTKHKLFTLICALVMTMGVFGIFGAKPLSSSAANEKYILVGKEGKTLNFVVPDAVKATVSANFVRAVNNGNNNAFKVIVSPMQQNAQLQRKAEIHFKNKLGNDVFVLHIKQSWLHFSISTNMIMLNKNAGPGNNGKFTITSNTRYKIECNNRFIIKTKEGRKILAGHVLGGDNLSTTSFVIYPNVANNTGKNITSTITIKAVGNNEVLGTIKVIQKG